MLEVMVIIFVSMGETQSLPMYEACLVVICSALQLLSGLAWLPLASLGSSTAAPPGGERQGRGPWVVLRVIRAGHERHHRPPQWITGMPVRHL